MATTRAKLKKTQINIKTTVASCDDLLIEILRRLPAKSIIRFQSVSKHWEKLLTQRDFTLLFDNLSTCHGFFCDDLFISYDVENQSPKPFHSLNFYRDPPNLKIVQSCNGLLLCCSSDQGPEYTRKYYVFNPTTTQYAVIPSVIGNHNIHTRFYGLAFHHTDCVHYKIVCVYRAKSNPNPAKKVYKIQIYSSDTGKWRISLKSFPVFISSFDATYVVYWNGVIYWALNRTPFWNRYCNMFYFILDSEDLRELPFPDYDDNGAGISYLGPFNITESRGHLHFLETTCHHGHLNVYEMLGNRSGWVLKYQVEHHELLLAVLRVVHNNEYYEFEILDVVRGEKEEDTFMLVGIRGKIMKYNIQDKSFKLLFDFKGTIKYSELKVYRYIESIGSF